LLAWSAVAPAQGLQRAQRLSLAQQEALRTRLNDNTLMIATSHPTASYFAMAHDITLALGKNGDLRVLPIASDGGIGNLRDLLFLRGVDMAIVAANALAHAKTTGSLGPHLPRRLAYITRLYDEEVHLLVARNITSVADLRGKKVAVPKDDGTAQFTAEDLFARIGIGIDPTKMHAFDAIERLRTGDLPAMLLIGGKPLPLLSGMPKDGSIRLLAMPFTRALEDGYTPAALRSDDYPALIPPGVTVETVAVSAVLMAHNAKGAEESAQRLAAFVPIFLNTMSERPLLDRHVKWKEVNLAATVPGWTRLAPAEAWLRKAKQQQALALQKSFEQFLRETRRPGSVDLSPPELRKLFDEFVSWTRKSLSDAGASTSQ
jgi:TRAP-type uncharacterized transport system substrate-binding protein